MLRSIGAGALLALLVILGPGLRSSIHGAVALAPGTPVATSLTLDASLGSAVLNVDDASAFSPGDVGVLNPRSANEETIVVAATNPFALASALTKNHSIGEPLVNITRFALELNGDLNCDGVIDSVDPLGGLLFLAGLPIDGGNCPSYGSGGGAPFGDLDCDDDIDLKDMLLVRLYVAGLPPLIPEDCRAFGPDPINPFNYENDVEAVDISAPDGEMTLNEPTAVQIQSSVLNTGPALVAYVSDSFQFDAPANCSITQPQSVNGPFYVVPFAFIQVSTVDVLVQCSEFGFKTFDMCLTTDAYQDIDDSNDEICSTFTIEVIPIADIAIIDFLLDLPDETVLGPFDAGEMTWNTKNFGPTGIDTLVTFRLSAAGAPALFYRWSAEIGDRCFFDDSINLIPVPCAEGHSDPSLPTATDDNCFDGFDNDNDGLTDFAGGDPDCIVPISELQFDAAYPYLQIEPLVERTRWFYLRCFAPGSFTLTLDNSQLPIPPGVDPDLDDNTASIEVDQECVVGP